MRRFLGVLVLCAGALAIAVPASADSTPTPIPPNPTPGAAAPAVATGLVTPYNIKDNLDATHQMVDVCCIDMTGTLTSATSSEPEGEFDAPAAGVGYVYPGWPWTGDAVQFDSLYYNKPVVYIREHTLDPGHSILGCWSAGPDFGDSHVREIGNCQSSGDTWFVLVGNWLVSVAWTQFHHGYPYGDVAEVDQGSNNYIYNYNSHGHPAAFNNQFGACNCG